MSDLIDMTPIASRPAARRAPDYPQITFGAGVLGFLGLLTCGVGLIWMTFGFVNIVSAFYSRVDDSSSHIGIAASSFSVGIALVLSGSITRMIGQVALAVRDIARNSFR